MPLPHVPMSMLEIMGGHRNKIINGDMAYWSRGTTLNVNGYVADRWLNSMVGQVSTVSRVALAAGSGVPGNPRFATQVVVSGAGAAGSYAVQAQFVEDVRTLSGRKATLSVWASVPVGQKIAGELLQDFGTGGSPSAVVSTPMGVKTSVTAAYVRYDFVADLPNVAGKILGTNNNDKLSANIWFSGGSDWNTRASNIGLQTGTFAYTHISLVEGDARNETDPFTPRHFADEYRLCQRYYHGTLLANLASRHSNLANGQLYTTGMFPVGMRSTPAMVALANAGYAVGEGVQVVFPQAGASAFERVNNLGFLFYGYVASGTGTTVNVPWLIGLYYTADAEL